MNSSFNPKKGASAIIAIGLSFLMIVVTLGVAESMVRTYKSVQASKDSFQAKILAESLQEELMLAAKNMEAGFSIAGDETRTDGPLSDVALYLQEISAETGADISFEYELQGMNSEAVEGLTSSDSWFTVPAANTGDAGYECNDLRPVLTRGDLEKYYPDVSNSSGAFYPSAELFNDNPLNHPCHWGKLGFGSNYSSKVNIPLYYQDGTGEIKNPADIDELLTKIIVRLKTPCKPIEERTGCMIHDTTSGSTDYVIDKSNPNCQYKDICEDGERWEFDTAAPGEAVSTGSGTVDNDETIVLWSITGECKDNETHRIETCTILSNDAMDADEKNRDLIYSSEIYESLLNRTKNNTPSLEEDPFKYLSLKIIPTPGQNAKTLGKDPYSKMEDFFTKETTPGYIYDFLINQWNLGGRSFGDKEPPCYDQAGCRDWSERTINKPVLQMSIITPELKEKDDNKNIPYLEYQILTDNPIANNSQIYTAIVRYNDQVYKLEKEIDRKVNVIDFAVHN